MINFLEETIEAVERVGQSVDDIAYCTDFENGFLVRFKWQGFVSAANFEYDECRVWPHGRVISKDLKLVFSNHSILWRDLGLLSEFWAHEAYDSRAMPDSFMSKLRAR